jgi:hypothetical protein
MLGVHPGQASGRREVGPTQGAQCGALVSLPLGVAPRGKAEGGVGIPGEQRQPWVRIMLGSCLLLPFRQLGDLYAASPSSSQAGSGTSLVGNGSRPFVPDRSSVFLSAPSTPT